MNRTRRGRAARPDRPLNHRLAWLLILPALCLPAPARASDPQALEQEYRHQWQARQYQANDSASRTALARELLEVARNATDPQRILFYAGKAYENGRRFLGAGYQIAADALDLIQRTDPTRRLWCLEQLEDLYARFYRARPTILPAGVAQAGVLEQIADERLAGLESALDGQHFDPAQAYKQADQATRDLAQAAAVLARVIQRARSDARLVASRLPQRSTRLLAYADKVQSLQQAIASRRRQLESLRQTWMTLHNAYRAFQASPTTKTATQLADALVCELDRPELLPPQALPLLSPDDRKALLLSCTAPADLAAPQAERLADWYQRKASQARSPAGRENCIIRAMLYARQAGLDNLPRLQAPNLRPTTIQPALHALAARLTYQFGRSQELAMANPGDSPSRPTPANPPAPATTGSDQAPPEDDHTPTSPPPSTGLPPASHEQNPPQAPVAAPPPVVTRPLVVTTSSRAGGRPLVTCQGCGRQFFPGWGNEKQTHCPYCLSGRKNIFDMQANSQME